MLRNLPPGVNELYVHAALDDPEMRAIGDIWAQRAADFAFLHRAVDAHACSRDLGITLIGYRAAARAAAPAAAC